MSLLFSVLAYLTGICVVTVNGNVCSPSHLYPYGYERGDHVIKEGDDSYYGIYLGRKVMFYGSQYDAIWLDINGVLSFKGAIVLASPINHPGVLPYFTPLWADVLLQSTDDGVLFYGMVNIAYEHDVVALVKNDSAMAGYPIEPDLILMFTWHKVHENGGSSDVSNTFQVVFATDGNKTVTIFNYETINWPNDDAAVAFDKGDQVTRVDYPFSMTKEVKNVVDYSNVGFPGKIVTRVDGDIQLQELTKYTCASCVVDRESGNLTTFDGFQELNVHEPNRKYLLSKEFNVDSNGTKDTCNYMLKITTDGNGRTEWVSFTINSILKWNMAFERQKKDTVEIRYRHVKKEIANFPFNEIIQDNGEELSVTIDRSEGGWIVRSQTCSYVLIYRPNAASKQLQFYLGPQYGGNSYGMCQNNNGDLTDDKKKCSRPPEDVTSDDFAAVIGQTCSCSRYDKRCKKTLSRL